MARSRRLGDAGGGLRVSERRSLQEAQSALVLAGKADARDPRPFRYLGEVLLRRGDAERSEKVLARATQLGSKDPDTRLWHDRAVVYVALQKRVGVQAVAAEVARTLPAKHPTGSPPAPTRRATRRGINEPITLPKAKLADLPKSSLPRTRQSSVPPRVPTVPPPLPPPPPAPAKIPPPSSPPAAIQSRPPPPLDVSGPLGQGAPLRLGTPPVPRLGGGAFADDDDETIIRAELPSFANPEAGLTDPSSQAPTARVPSGLPPPSLPGAPTESAPPPSINSLRPEDLQNAVEDTADSRAVLEHLARVGIYEPEGGAPPAWERAPRLRRRSVWVFVVASVLLVGGGVGGYFYAQDVKAKKVAQAKSLGDAVEKALRRGSPDGLRATDEKMARMFELDSRSQRAARLWLENRVLGAIILPEPARGIDSAISRAKTVGLKDEEVAFGRVASFLVEGDLAGAAAQLPKWDKRAGKDAYYQLAAASALERAGDQRCIERYQAARALDSKLRVVDLLLAQQVLLEFGPKKAGPLVERARKKWKAGPDERALAAMLWALNPSRSAELPPYARLAPGDEKKLILPLRPAPQLVRAVGQLNAEKNAEAVQAIKRGIDLSVGPAMATTFGFLAIQAGDEKLARSAALQALRFSALYPNARVLASRVALLGGRLEEAKKAIKELDPKSQDVAIVRAVIAYETLDEGELGAALEALGDERLKRSEFSALASAPRVLAGTYQVSAEKLHELSSSRIPWGEMVAMDQALNMGDLALAEKLRSEWAKGSATRPVYALRESRRLRADSKLTLADKASLTAMRGTVTLAAVVERVLVLVDGQSAKAGREVIAKYASTLGPVATWLGVLVDASTGRTAAAKIKAGQLEPFGERAPLLLQVLSARALAAVKDKRAKGLVTALSRRWPKNQDILKAAEALK